MEKGIGGYVSEFECLPWFTSCVLSDVNCLACKVHCSLKEVNSLQWIFCLSEHMWSTSLHLRNLSFPFDCFWWQGAIASDTVGYICAVLQKKKLVQENLKSRNAEVSLLILNSATYLIWDLEGKSQLHKTSIFGLWDDKSSIYLTSFWR